MLYQLSYAPTRRTGPIHCAFMLSLFPCHIRSEVPLTLSS